jgi:hypothetical protein
MTQKIMGSTWTQFIVVILAEGLAANYSTEFTFPYIPTMSRMAMSPTLLVAPPWGRLKQS